MRQIQATDAKVHFSQLLGDVERGETVEITRHGKVVAHLVPVGDAQQINRANAMRDFLEARDRQPRVKATLAEILAWRHEGHKY